MSEFLKCWLGLALATVCCAGCRARLEVVEDGDALVIRGTRAEIRFEDGRITSLTGPDGMRATGDIRERCGRVGLGVMTDAHNISYMHWPFISPLVGKNRLDERQASFRSPDKRSVRTVVRDGDSVTVKWAGLSNVLGFFPKDELAVTFGLDGDGAITVRACGLSPDGGVFGVQTPIENLDDSGAFVLPLEGGIRFDIASMKKGVWSLYCDFIYCQAPVAAIETPKGAFGVWSEDDGFSQFQAYFPKGDKTAAFAFEWMTLMPYERQTEVRSPVMKIDAFPGKDWLGAATPYRSWYRKRFAKELAVRDATWARETEVIINTAFDKGKNFDAHLDTLTNLFGKTVLFNYFKMTTESTLPPNRYDWGLPGHTPDLSYLPALAERQKRGIRCACYANAFCANYGSPEFKRAKVDEFAVPTLNMAYMYRPLSKGAISARTDAVTETASLQQLNTSFDGRSTEALPEDSPAAKWKKMKFGDQALVYLDVNPRRWRDYIIGVHRNLVCSLGLDALYQDCLGVIRDVGNGVTDGTGGAMGSYLLARELQQALPIPFQTEGGPAPVAMVSSFPLNSGYFCSDKPEFFRYRQHNAVPLCSYLFGYRPICGGHEAYRSVAQRFSACACNDALGGLGAVTEPPWGTKSGINDHMVVRSLVFARKGLLPYFPPEGRMPEGVTCMYRDKDGGLYSYHGHDPVQVMYGPDGRPLWGRASGVSEFDVPGLELPGWPLRKGSRHLGLKAENSYALFPVDTHAPDVSMVYGEIDESDRIVLAYDTSAFTYLELDGKAPQIAFKAKESRPDLSRVILRSNGIEEVSARRKLSEEPRSRVKGGIELCRIQGPNAFRTIDFVHTVRKGEAVRVYAQNREFGTQLSDGSTVGIYVNGEFQVGYDSAPAKNPKYRYQHGKMFLYDYRMHKFTVPLDAWVGKTVLVSVRIDMKGGAYDDAQDVSVPEIVPFAGEPKDEIVKGMVPEAAYRGFEGGEPVRE